MNIINFFNSDILELPKEYKDKSYYDFIDQCFNLYMNKIDKLPSEDQISLTIKNNKKAIQDICTGILEAIKAHYVGHPAKAYEKIDAIFKYNGKYLDRLITPKDVRDNLQNLYRIRIDNNSKFEKKDLFHIPFELRHIVNVQRYSIPGVPSLYLGGSAYVCWEEFNQPDLNRVHIARFSAQEKIKVLDFGYRSAHIAAMLDYQINKKNCSWDNLPEGMLEFVVAHAVFWPLLCASSIKVLHKDAPFKPEYLIPQYILQWITSNDKCDGIRYFSCRIDYYPNVIHSVANYVFPTKSSNNNGFCNVLKSKFSMSDPLNYKFAKATKMSGVPTPYNGLQLMPAKNKPVNYSNSEFAEMEYMVQSLELEKIK